jgi:hypothetical protein
MKMYSVDRGIRKVRTKKKKKCEYLFNSLTDCLRNRCLMYLKAMSDIEVKKMSCHTLRVFYLSNKENKQNRAHPHFNRKFRSFLDNICLQI